MASGTVIADASSNGNHRYCAKLRRNTRRRSQRLCARCNVRLSTNVKRDMSSGSAGNERISVPGSDTTRGMRGRVS
jgi:hypothetical protein